ncbi:NAD(P)-dependent alcohol dehydrogenase [Nonlabens antarcticus]|uniref:NAD(P)-dependent alcohol dehydrogenase n=1 Tax=Nonlabens antarcticus TaxID=392714 RepID=UPI0018913850|nr:NAD(P)-dependent alcohol dehydrogenase [Nonlabens antarcticus]
MKTKAAVVNKKEDKFEIQELTLAPIQSREILVKIKAVGLCHTDLSVKAGNLPTNYPVVLGHEGSGVVEKVGDSITAFKKGDHVVLSYGSCGSCRPCLEGNRGYCLDFNPLNFMNKRLYDEKGVYESKVNGSFFQQSSFAEYAIVSDQNLVKIDNEVPLELMGPLGCGIQTGAGTVMNTLNPNPGSTIAIFGVGSVGLSALMASKIAGCRTIIAVDLNNERLKLAEELGATHSVNPKDVDDVVATIREIVAGGVDYAVECSGVKEVATQAFDSLYNTGTLALVGAPPGGTKYTFDANDWILGGRKIRGVVEGDSIIPVYIPRLIELYKQGRFPFDKLVTYYDFKDINQAVEDMEAGKVIKPVIKL